MKITRKTILAFSVLVMSTMFVLFTIFSCGVNKNVPSWTNIGSEGTYVEYCRDTLSFKQLDSVCKANKIYTNFTEWPEMEYDDKDTYMIQWSYNNTADTLYTITGIIDKNTEYKEYIFVKRVLNKSIE